MERRRGIRYWLRSGEPFVWLNAAAVTICVMTLIAVLLILLLRGGAHFWPRPVTVFEYGDQSGPVQTLAGQLRRRESVSVEQIRSAGIDLQHTGPAVDRLLVQLGNRDIAGTDFRWLLAPFIVKKTTPSELMVVERREWGNLYGYLVSVGPQWPRGGGDGIQHSASWDRFQQRILRAKALRAEMEGIQKREMAALNIQLERLRKRERAIELGKVSEDRVAAENIDIAARRASLADEHAHWRLVLEALARTLDRDAFVVRLADGREISQPVASVVRAYRPNELSLTARGGLFLDKLWEFLSSEPREANAEGGVFPAIFGTVLMVLVMSVMVTPFGILAAVYLREYAPQGGLTRVIRVAVNNLAGVPSIVYGLFGLGFFVYAVGGSIDGWFFQENLPAPTFGTPGLFWASFTLALLTLPVVIVATEEGLARVPAYLRESSLALGATRLQTVLYVVLPTASPALMTGLILAVARAAGEVAPLMLVGVVKLAPALPLDGNFPYLHLERKFMHLGFHIYDVGFQSPNIEAARPLVYATALLLVTVIIALNLTAITIRGRLREKLKQLEPQ